MNLDISKRLIQEGNETVLLTRIENKENDAKEKEVKTTAIINKRHKKQSKGLKVFGKSKIITHSTIKEKRVCKEENLAEGQMFEGIYGEIDMKEGSYLVYIKESRKVGEFAENTIYEALSCGVICIDGLNDPQVQNLLDEFFRIPGLFYSSCNLSGISSNLKENTDFIYNYIPLSRFQQKNPDAADFGISLIQGYFGQENLTGKIDIKCTILSRRSWRNAGTRYYARGADSNGDAANTVETLIIFETAENTCSFIQCRGSIPLSWEQKIDLSYKPPVRMGNYGLSKHLFLKHLNVLEKRYKKYFFITLLDENGHEKKLNEEFLKILKEEECLYLAVDYHKMIKSSIKKKQFKKDLKEILSNKAIIRTNCVDCLDRTNVVQAQLSKIRMVEMLGLKEISKYGDVLDIDDYLNKASIKKFGLLWNSNANALSMQYTGTSALKNDLTQHGTRTFKGLIQDAISSGKRYVNNNFTDGRMQEIIELVTGVRNTQGNCIRGDKRIGLYIVICSIFILYLYRYSYYIANTVLVCALILFRTVLNFYLSFPSPLKKLQTIPMGASSELKKNRKI